MTFWVLGHWFDLLQTVGIVSGLFFTAYTVRKDEVARKIGNAIAINGQYLQIWRELYAHPNLGRVLSNEVDLAKQPISKEEELFITMLILHLGTAYQAMRHGEFVKLEELQRDVKSFFSLPIPKAVWATSKRLQNQDFAAFIESSLK